MPDTDPSLRRGSIFLTDTFGEKPKGDGTDDETTRSPRTLDPFNGTLPEFDPAQMDIDQLFEPAPLPRKVTGAEITRAEGTTESSNQGSEVAAQNRVLGKHARDHGTIANPGVSSRKRGGRGPSLVRAEVDAIRADNRPINELAAHWGVSPNTIRRVKGHGVYVDSPYIPADEYDRSIYVTGASVQPPMNPSKYRGGKRGEASAGRPLGRQLGRPLKERPEDLTEFEIKNIAWSTERTRDLAAKYRVSTGTIANIRRIMRGTLPPGVTLEQAIRADPRDHGTIARRYDVALSFVERVKREQMQELEQGGSHDATPDAEETEDKVSDDRQND